MANILNRIGLLKRIAYWIVLKCGGNFTSMAFGVFLGALAVSVVTFSGGSIIIAALCYGICSSLNIMKTKEGAIIMMVGMLGASTTRMFLYYPLSMGAILGSIRAVDPDFTFGFAELFKYNWPVLIYCLIAIWVLLLVTKTTKSNLGGGKEYFASEYAKLGKMGREEKIGAMCTILLMLWVLTSNLHGYDAMYGFIFVPLLYFLPGINIGTNQDIREIPLGIILFFASCMAIGAVCGAVGITDVITEFFSPLFDQMGVVGALFTTLIFGAAINFAMTPIAMVASFSGMLYQIAVSIGIDPLAFIFVFNHSTDMVFLPYEYLTFLIFFSFGCMTTGQFLKYHTLKNLLFFVFFGVVMIPYWMLVGLI